MTPKEILEKARVLIAQKGLAKNAYRLGPDGPYCVVGAIRQVIGGDPYKFTQVADASYRECQTRIVAAIARRYPGKNWDAITFFNDDPATKKEDALAVLREAADAP